MKPDPQNLKVLMEMSPPKTKKRTPRIIWNN